MNYLETLKNISKDKEKKVENLIFLVILLVVFLISLKYMFSSNKGDSSKTSEKTDESTIKTTSTSNDEKTNLETKLETILSQISGISEASIVLTYSEDSKQTPVYNTKEEEKKEEKITEKSVAYNENGGSKSAIIESIQMPKVEGAIVVAKGASTVEIKSKIANAIATVVSIPAYKVQVFEKQG